MQRWICPSCIQTLWQQSRSDIHGRVTEAWQTVEFKIELQAVLAEHRKMIALEEYRTKAAAMDDTMDVDMAAAKNDTMENDTMDVDI